MARHSGPTARNLFPGHNAGPGKGDKNRTVETAEYRAVLAAIDWHRDQPDGFSRQGNKLVKRYGPAEVIPNEEGPHIKVL